MVECKYFRMMGTIPLRMRSEFFVNILYDLVYLTASENLFSGHSLKAHHTVATSYFNLKNLVTFNIIYQTGTVWANMKFSQ